jgi:hypothetical protein
LLGGPKVTGPQYFFSHLLDSAAECGVYQDGHNRPFSSTGNYSIAAVNHWLWEHTFTPAMLVEVASISYYGSTDTSLTKEEILQRAPQQCTALLLWYEHGPGRIKHYKAWMQAPADGHWYECESMEYADT